MKLKNVIAALSKRTVEPAKAIGYGEPLGGFKVIVPPGKSLLVHFEGRQGEVEINFPTTGHPTTSIRTHPKGKVDVTLFHYRPLEPVDDEEECTK